jgi:hypothetical protein
MKFTTDITFTIENKLTKFQVRELEDLADNHKGYASVAKNSRETETRIYFSNVSETEMIILREDIKAILEKVRE